MDYTNLSNVNQWPIDNSDYIPIEASGYVCIDAYNRSAIDRNHHYIMTLTYRLF